MMNGNTKKQNKYSKVLLALVAAGLAGGTASTVSAQTVINISGATLSCRNVMNGVKRLLALQRVVLAHE